VHLDDLYEGWAGLDGVEARLVSQVLDPVAAGRVARFHRYDWSAREFADWVSVPSAPVLVVEGCGSASRRARDRATLVVWVEAPADLRLERGLTRDGDHVRDEWVRWLGLETVHFARESTRASADVVVDGTVPLR
jgi:uridine kinase